MKKSKILAALLSAVMAVSAFGVAPFTVSAAESDSEAVALSGTTGDCKWLYARADSDGYLLRISGNGAMADYDDMTDMPWYSVKDNIIRIEVEEGVTRVGNHAFTSCSRVTRLSLPDSLESIGEFAFNGCDMLDRVYIPDKVETIDNYAFNYCEKLSDFLMGKNVKKIGDYAFSNTALTYSFFPRDIKSIGYRAFGYKSSGRTSFTVYGEDRSAANLYADINRLSFRDIYECPIADCNFTFDYSAGKMTIAGNGRMEDYARGLDAPWKPYAKYIKSVEFKDGVTYIGNRVFDGYLNIAELSLGNTVTEIGTRAFYEDTGISSVTFPDSLEKIGADAFSYTGLTEAKFGLGLKTVGESAFSSKKLKKITVPYGIQTISEHAFGYYLFNDYEKVDGVTLYGYANTEAERYADDNPHITFVPLTLTEGKTGDCYWRYDPDNYTLTIYGSGRMADYNYIWDGSEGYYDAPWEHLKDDIYSIVIENGVTYVGKRAFCSMNNLTEVSLGNDLSEIGEAAFSGNNTLYKANFPDSLVTIGRRAFSGCALDSISFGSKLKTIGEGAFLSYQTSSATIPDNVTSIGECAFGYYFYEVEMPFSGYTIYGYTGSAAETYAEENPHITFVPIQSTDISGRLKTYLSPNTPSFVQLLDPNNKEAIDECMVYGNSGSYKFKNVSKGNYYLRVIKRGHAIVDIPVSVNKTSVTKDLVAYPLGDADIDGEVSINDATIIQYKLAELLDEDFNIYQEKSADVNRNGTVAIDDATKLQYYLAGLESLY